jgi:hypothetical protein
LCSIETFFGRFVFVRQNHRSRSPTWPIEILTDEQASPFLTTHEENDVCQRKEANEKIEKTKDFMPVVSINSKPKCFGEVSPRQTKEAPLNFLSQLHFHEKQLLDQLGAD